MPDNTVGNAILRVGADSSGLETEMKKAQNTILTFKNESLAALKSFGLPHISSTNLVESIQSGQRVVVNFARESTESLTQFQTRVRTVFEEAGIDISAYEKALQDANQIHAEFAKGAMKNFQAVSASADEVNNKANELKESFGKSFNGITANIGAFKDSVGNAFSVLKDGGASAGEKFSAVSGAVVDGFGLMTGAAEIFIAVEVVKKVAEWIGELDKLAAEVQDVEHRFYASMGEMSDKAEGSADNLSKSYGILDTTIKDQMSKEYLNTRMLGFDPEQSEKMSEQITQLSYDLGKLRGQDPSTVFTSLQYALEGQTRGLRTLGISISATDLKNRALAEGVIKQGETMTTAQTALMAYQAIMEKTQGVMGYYKTTAGDLSTEQTKLNTGWQEMKEKLATDLTPAFTGLLKAVNFVATGIESFVEDTGTAIEYISLFAEDAYSAIRDVISLNFGQINADWDNNYNSIFNSAQAAKQYGESLDGALSATNAQDAAQQALGASLNANTMSFDQVHNMTQAGTGAALAQADAVNNLADAMSKIKGPEASDITDNKSKGIVIPIAFKIPPFPTMTPPPAVPVAAIDNASPVINLIKAELSTLFPVTVPVFMLNYLEPAYSQMENALKAFSPTLINVKVEAIDAVSSVLVAIENKISQWETEALQDFTAVKNGVSAWETNAITAFENVESAISQWEMSAAKDFNLFSSELSKDVGTGISSAEQMIASWVNATSQDFATFDANVGTAISTFSAELHNDFNQALSATESMVVSWANSVGQEFISTMNQAISAVESLGAAAGQTISNVGASVWHNVTDTYENVANWVADNKSWIIPTVAVAGAVGLTIATGGADLLAAGGLGALAGAGAEAAETGAAAGAASNVIDFSAAQAARAAGTSSLELLKVSGLATGGIVPTPQVHILSESEPEAVIPLSQFGSVMRNSGMGTDMGSGGSGSNGGQSIIIQLENKMDGRTFGRAVYQYIIREGDRHGTQLGYNTIYNLPG